MLLLRDVLDVPVDGVPASASAMRTPRLTYGTLEFNMAASPLDARISTIMGETRWFLQHPQPPAEEIERNVSAALVEDIGPGDLTAGLIPADRIGRATVISREDAVLCGTAWFDRVFRCLDPAVKLSWRPTMATASPGDQLLCEIEGSARALSAERSGLNFLQLLSGVATKARQYADVVAGTKAVVVDTRKTIPGPGSRRNTR